TGSRRTRAGAVICKCSTVRLHSRRCARASICRTASASSGRTFSTTRSTACCARPGSSSCSATWSSTWGSSAGRGELYSDGLSAARLLGALSMVRGSVLRLRARASADVEHETFHRVHLDLGSDRQRSAVDGSRAPRLSADADAQRPARRAASYDAPDRADEVGIRLRGRWRPTLRHDVAQPFPKEFLEQIHGAEQQDAEEQESTEEIGAHVSSRWIRRL